MWKVFILCAGDGTRWNGYLGIPKQLIAFGGETLVDRIVRQVHERLIADIVIVSRNAVPIYSRGCDALLLDSTSSLVETISHTAPYWREVNIFILGDVFFTERAIAKVLTCKRGLAFFGRPWPSAFARCGHGELFGMMTRTNVAERVNELISVVVQDIRSGLRGNLWNLYQAAAGVPYGSSSYMKDLLVVLDDVSNDIDTSRDYLDRCGIFEQSCGENRQTIVSRLHGVPISMKHALGIVLWALRGSATKYLDFLMARRRR
jgi:molybdopterin-guanine dinucleotide biosynthesis protein A